MKHYNLSLKINSFVRFILIFVGTIISILAIFGGNIVTENGIQLNKADARWFRFKLLIFSLLIGGSMLLITENIKYSLMSLGVGFFTLISLILFSLDLQSLPIWKMIGFLCFYIVPFYLFSAWLFYLEFKNR